VSRTISITYKCDICGDETTIENQIDKLPMAWLYYRMSFDTDNNFVSPNSATYLVCDKCGHTKSTTGYWPGVEGFIKIFKFWRSQND
jgi:hypothetical protein